MITVSPEFTAAAAATRRRAKAKVDITWTDPYVDIAVDVTASSVGATSWEDQCADLIKETPHKYFILDGLSTLDGTFWIAPGTQVEANANQFGWYSAEVCDANGDFSTPPELLVEFAARTVMTLRFVAEPTISEYPVDFEMYVYENGESGSNYSYYTEVTGNSLVEYTKDISAEELFDVTSIKLVINKWSQANTICKIVEAFEAITDTLFGDSISSMTITEEREIRDGTLPVGNVAANMLDIEFQNVKIVRGGNSVIDPFFPENDASYLKNFMLPNRRVKPYVGFRLPDLTVEYVCCGTFWTGEWQISDKNFSVSVSCLDRLGLLKQSIFECDTLFVGENLKTIAEYVLQYAKDNIPMLDLAWEISDDLEDFVIPLAWFNKKDYAATLRDITEACLGQCYMRKDDVLVITGYSENVSTTTDFTITKSMYFDRSQPSNIKDIANYIEVETQPLTESSDVVNVYTSASFVPIDASGSQANVEVRYTETPVSNATASISEVTGGIDVVISGVNYYPWGAVMTIVNNTASAGSYKISVTGNVYTVYGQETIVRQDDQSIFEHGTFPYRMPINHLVQSTAVATTIAENLLLSYKNQRRDIILQWIGTPALELGDQINAPEYQRGSINNTGEFKVIKNVINFDGTLRETTTGRKVA
jgi:hypothetical protein